MAHVRQEDALGAVGRLGRVARLAQLLLIVLSLGHVCVRACHTVGLAVGIPQSPAAGQNPAPASILVLKAELHGVVGTLIVQILVQRRHHAVVIVRVQQLFEGGEVVRQLIILVADHALPAWGKEDRTTADVPVPDAVIGPAYGQGEAFLAFGQLTHRLFRRVRQAQAAGMQHAFEFLNALLQLRHGVSCGMLEGV